MPDLTVLLPVRDAAAYLQAALDSLSDQTWGDWTCLALDDGSRDGSGEILLRHARADRRFQVLANKQGTGVARALVRLLAMADTPWVARMDADDVSHPQRFEYQWGASRAQPEVALWGTQVEAVGEASSGWRAYLDWLNSVVDSRALIENAFTDCPLPHSSWLAKRDALVSAGGYRVGTFPEDYDLFLTLLRKGVVFGKVEESLLGVRDHPARETHTSPRTDRDAMLRLKARHLALGLKSGDLPHLPNRPLAIWGAGKTGRGLRRELDGYQLAVEAFIDPLKAGRVTEGIPVLGPEKSPPGKHLLLVAVGPRHIRQGLERRFAAERREFARDFLWLF